MNQSNEETKFLIVFLAFVAICLWGAIYVSPDRAATLSPSELLIDGESADDVFRSCNKLVPHLSPRAKTRFIDIRFEYIAAFGESRACDLIRGRTVQQVFDEYKPTNIKPVAEGVDDSGTEWSLYAAPNREDADDESTQ